MHKDKRAVKVTGTGGKDKTAVMETPKQRLLKQILALRDSIEAEKGILSESYLLVREDRER